MTSHKEAVANAARRLLPQVSELASDILAACRNEIPAYAQRTEPEFEQELLATFARQASAILELQVSGRPVVEEDLAGVEAFARRRFAQGFSRTEVIRAYNVGIRLGLARLVSELHNDVPLPAHLDDISRQVIGDVMGSAGVVNDAIVRAYQEAERDAASPVEGERMKNLREVLEGDDRAEPIAADRLIALGLMPASFFMCAVVDRREGGASPEGSRRAQELHQQLCAALRVAPGCVLVDTLEDDLIVIIGHGSATRDGELLHTFGAWSKEDRGSLIGVGRPEPGMAGIALSYRQARSALEILHAFKDVPSVMTYDQSLPYLLLRANRSITAEILRVSVTPLIAHDENPSSKTPLLPVLRAYLEAAGNRHVAADQIKLHRHTFRRRLEQIESLTGTSVQGPRNMLLFALGLLAADQGVFPGSF